MGDADGVDNGKVGQPEPRQRKRPYAKPKMQEYGSIAKLTQSGGSTKPEVGTMRAGTCL